MTEPDHDVLIRIDERTARMEEAHNIILKDHEKRLRSAERHKNILHGVWLAIVAYLGINHAH